MARSRISETSGRSSIQLSQPGTCNVARNPLGSSNGEQMDVIWLWRRRTSPRSHFARRCRISMRVPVSSPANTSGGRICMLGTDQNAAIHLYTHERACPEARSARGRGCPMTRGRGSARGLVQCRRGRITEQREPVVDPLSGQALVSAGPLVPSPAPCAQIEPGTEQREKALGGALVDVEIGA